MQDLDAKAAAAQQSEAFAALDAIRAQLAELYSFDPKAPCQLRLTVSADAAKLRTVNSRKANTEALRFLKSARSSSQGQT